MILENSAHMTFVEENEAYCNAVRQFLSSHVPADVMGDGALISSSADNRKR